MCSACVWLCVCVCVCVCERVKEFVVWFRIAPSLDTVTALHRRQAPCSYMQVTVVAPQSLASNDRKPRDRASQRGRLSACEERTEAGEKRRADEPSPLTRAAAAQAPGPARGRGGEAPRGEGGGGAGGGGSIQSVDPETPGRCFHCCHVDYLQCY